jgi:hypothetical protein
MEEDSDKRHFTGRRHFESSKGGKGDVAIFVDKEEIGFKWFFS